MFQKQDRDEKGRGPLGLAGCGSGRATESSASEKSSCGGQKLQVEALKKARSSPHFLNLIGY